MDAFTEFDEIIFWCHITLTPTLNSVSQTCAIYHIITIINTLGVSILSLNAVGFYRKFGLH